MEGFGIRFITTKTGFENIVIKAMVKEQWRLGLHDTKCYETCDAITTLVGELDGKPIGRVILTALALLALYRVRGIQRQGVWKEDFRRCIGKFETVEEHCAVSWATSRENVREKWFS